MLRVLFYRLPLGWAGRLALQRLLSQWHSLLTIIAGTLLGASVGALIPLYSTTVAQVSMVERLNELPLEEVHALASLSVIPSQLDPPQTFAQTVEGYQAQYSEIISRTLSRNFPGWLARTVFFGETSALAINPPAEITEPDSEPRIPDPTLRVFVAYYEGWPEAVALVSGRLPGANAEADVEADIEIAVPLEAQTALGIALNTVLTLDQGGPRGGWPSSKNVRARVVGIVNLPEQLSPVQRAYFMPPSPVRVAKLSGEFTAEFPVLTTRTAFERVATEFIPDTPTRFGWRLIFDHTRLPFSRSPEARAALLDYNNALAAAFRDPTDQDSQQNPSPRNLQLVQQGRLIDWRLQSDQNVDLGLLLDYERSARALEAPFGLLLLQVGALVIFFLLVTAALVRRGERREIAMLQSRGATDRALVTIRGIEAFVLCALAALTAPVIAQQVLIAITPFFARYPNLPLLLTPTVFAYAAAAAAVAFVALMFTLRPVLRMPLIASGGAAQRSDVQPWWQRYYVDVLLAVLGMAALLRLVGRETPLFTTSAGGSAADLFLLLAPALLFLGLGSVLLRVFPALAAGAARALAAGRGLLGPMAAWQLSREPIHYGRITFLLALAIGIGWFATSFRATVERSQNDQAQYRIGTDIRLNERDLRLNVARARAQEAYTAVPGVAAASIAWRQPNVNFQGNPNRPAAMGQLLAVDADTFQDVIYWRPDLGVVNTPRPLGQPTLLPEVGEALPFIPQKLSLWARFDIWTGFDHRPDLDRLRNRTAIYARLRDAAGAWLQVPFKIIEVEHVAVGPQVPGAGGGGAFITSGWAYFEADLTALSYRPVEPLRLVSIYWQHRGRGNSGERFLRLTLADLSATNVGGTRQGLGLFNNQRWEFAYDSGAFSQGNATPGMISGKGQGIATMWEQTAESARVGLLLNYPQPGAVPLIASRGLIEQLGWQPGQKVSVRSVQGLTVEFELRNSDGGQRYYPTLYDAYQRDGQWVTDGTNARISGPFAIADRDALLYALNRRPSAALYPDEVWLKAAPGTDLAVLLEALRPTDRSAAFTSARTLSGELATLQTDPLSRGLLGLMFLAFIVAMVLSIVGLLTYAALTASARRTEFGVLRALGLSSQRVIGQLALEQCFIIALGALLGGILGAVLSSQVVPRLAQDASGAQITPPFIVQVETAALMQYGAIILSVLLLVLLTSLLLVRQLSLSRTLRLGEE